MKLKITAILLAVLMLACAAGCTGPDISGLFNTPEATEQAAENTPEATAEATLQPTEPPADAELTFINRCGATLDEVYISFVEETEWGEPVGEAVADGAEIYLSFEDIGGDPFAHYDFGAVDSTGLNYDVFDFELGLGSVIELVVEGEGCVLKVTDAAGDVKTYDVDVYMPGEQEASEFVGVYLEEYFDSVDSEESGCIMDIHYGLPVIADYSVDDYGALTSTMDDVRGELLERINNDLHRLSAKLAEPEEDVPAWLWWPDAYDFDSLVRRADSKVLSILYVIEYSVHSDHTKEHEATVIDSATGERLCISDIVTDISLIAKYLNDESENAEGGRVLDERADYSEYFNTPTCPDFAWTLDNVGLSFWFNDYEGPFYEMCFNYNCPTLSFAEYPELFKQEYLPVSDEFAMEIPLSTETKLVLQDEVVDFAVSVFPAEYDDEEGQVDGYVGDEMFSFTAKDFDKRAVYLHTTHGDYLYMQGYDEYWQMCLFAYELSPEGVAECGSEWVWFNQWYASEDDSLWGTALMTELITDPTSFALAESCDMIGTADAVRYYSVGYEDGLPVTFDDYAYFSNRWLTVKKAFTAVEVDFDGEPTGEEYTVSAGTEVLCLRTDLAEFCDIYVNGSILRLYLESDPNSDHWKYYGEDYILDLFEDVDFYD